VVLAKRYPNLFPKVGNIMKEFMIKKNKSINDTSKEVKKNNNDEGTNQPIKTEIEKPEIISKFDEILNNIKNYQPQPVRDEKKFENQVYAFLRAKYPQYKINPQYNTTKGKIDIVIDDEIALELIIADNRANIRSLHGQIFDYKKIFNKLGLIILDVNTLSDLHEYVEEFNKIGGVKAIVIKGQLRRKKGHFIVQRINR
jgi:hypothetical protein